MPTSRRQNRAFTLVEILVVIVIIGLLLAILFPAIQAARSAARSTGSKNNLRQIGIASLNFESRTGHYPPSWTETKTGSNSTDVQGWSIHAILLPYMEQKLLTSNIDFTRDYTNSNDVTLADGTTVKLSSMRVPTYVSPGNPRDEVRFSGGVAEHYPVDYAVNCGQFFVWDPVTGEGGSGMAYPNSKITSSHVADGLSYTVYFAEVKSWQVYMRNAGHSHADIASTVPTSDPFDIHVVDGTDGTTTLFDTLNSGASPDFKNALPGSGSGHTEWVDGRVHQIGFTTTFTPNAPLLHEHTDGQIYDVDWTNWQEGKGLRAATPVDTPTYAIVNARSHFEGGVNVVMADGSVKWVDNSIELPIWRAYGSRAGEEMIPPAKQL